MKISGSHTIAAPREAVWDALQDPAVLARALPGCQSLEVTGPDRYSATLNAGVASIKGTYRGNVAMLDKRAPDAYRLQAEGAGGPGTVRADALVTLEDDGGGTLIRYDADAVLGGMIGGVGQRVLSGVATKTAGDFFSAIERDIREGPPVAAVVPGAPEPVGVGAQAPAAPAVGQVFRAAPEAAPAAAAAGSATQLLLAAVTGAAIALAGVLVGRRLARGH
jgi:uncharacterized protein